MTDDQDKYVALTEVEQRKRIQSYLNQGKYHLWILQEAAKFNLIPNDKSTYEDSK